MKKVCVQTWFNSLNFGTTLQAYALFCKLRSLGYDVAILDGIGQGLQDLLNRIKVLISRTFVHREPKWMHERRRAVRKWCTNNFIIHHINSKKDLEAVIQETDCFISGSDQIWNTYFEFNTAMFLSFAQEKKRISYASSIGTANVNPIHANAIRELLSLYSHISVREETGARALQQLTGRSDITQVPDPTFLLSKDEWLSLDQGVNDSIQKPYILCYLLGSNPEYPNFIKKISTCYNASNVVLTPSLENPGLSIPNSQILTTLNASQFIHLISHAQLICTDSFHATALAAIMQRPFIDFLRFSDGDTLSQNSRIHDLLSHLNLNDRIFTHSRVIPQGKIDFSKVNQIIELDRKLGTEYLKASIEN